ncbi:hypothetical protein [Pseudooctadecabacter sp.]|uniref:hypothetical protein n=1 Tax=Pseudooctadecabacter sp. TaxID=1966338 RepID=UPI0035C79501
MNYESPALNKIHDKRIVAKNECFFIGFIEGIVANNRVDVSEVEPLLAECAALCRQVHDEDAFEIIEEASAGHFDTVAELLELLRQIIEIRLLNIDQNCKRSSANRILGFCAGINCDADITKREAEELLEKLDSDHDLSSDPRISALYLRVVDALEDGLIDSDESDEIGNLIAALVGDSFSDTGIASSDSIPVIQDLDQVDMETLEGKKTILTGKFRFGTRNEVTEKLTVFGADVQRNTTNQTEIVIVGSEGSPFYTHKNHGGKLAKALNRRMAGTLPRIYVEGQFRKLLG